MVYGTGEKEIGVAVNAYECVAWLARFVLRGSMRSDGRESNFGNGDMSVPEMYERDPLADSVFDEVRAGTTKNPSEEEQSRAGKRIRRKVNGTKLKFD
jgi:hypothetical protein